MKKISEKQKIIILIAIALIIVITGIIVGANAIIVNIANGRYNSANNDSSNGNLLPEYIKQGVTIGGITGTLEVLDTSDATATAEDIAYGKTAYVNGVKIEGTRPIKKVKDLIAGEKVKYDTGVTSVGDNGIINCIVLYDEKYNQENNTNYGIQIIAEDIVEEVALGSDNFRESVNSYNNGIATLNSRAEKYINTTYATDARCVGSIPNNKNYETNGFYSRSDSWFSKYGNTFKNRDNNYEEDYNQMISLNVADASTTYWLASRRIDDNANWRRFWIKNI